MAYRVVFDFASRDAQPWTFGLLGFLFIAIGAVLVAIVRRRGSLPFRGWNEHPKRSALFAYFMFGFAVIWTTTVYVSLFREHATLSEAVAQGYVKVVEGPVEKFHPMPASGHDTERFCVQNACFSYSDYAITFGFNNTSSHGGPIRAGLQVRVTYVGDTIVKLEVAS
jgi:hypothetical protein